MAEPFAGFVPPLPTAVAIVVVTYLVVYPTLTLCHELGHAAFCLRYTDGDVVVRLGVDPVARATVGRFTLAVSAFPGLAGGSCSFGAYPGRRTTAAAMFLAGPAVTGALLCLIGWGVTVASAPPVRFALLLSGVHQAITLALTALPVEYQSQLGLTEPAYDGFRSDGDLAIAAWRGADLATDPGRDGE